MSADLLDVKNNALMQIPPVGVNADSAFCPAGKFFLLAGVQNPPSGQS